MDAIPGTSSSLIGDIPSWQLNKNLGSCLIELYQRKLWTDVEFRCKDHDEDDINDRIHAHKAILAARSPFFQQMLFGAFIKREMYIDAEKRIFDLLLRYVYSDDIPLCEDTASGVLQLAHMYQIPSLVKKCADYLEAFTLTPENACDILQLAMLYEIRSLKEASCLVIDKNACVILNTGGFMNLSKDALFMILKGNTFLANEKEILEMVKKWPKKQLAEKQPEPSDDTVIDYVVEFFGKLEGKERFQIFETMECNTDEPEVYRTNHNVVSAFEIKVSKYVKLISFTVCDIEPSFEYDHCVLENYDADGPTGDSLADMIRMYTDKVIRLTEYRKHYRWRDRRVLEYNAKDKVDLSKDSFPAIYGVISIPTLNFEQTFLVNPLKAPHEVFLRKPLKLKKSTTAYSVELALKYKCCMRKVCCSGDKRMIIKCCRMIEKIQSPKGHVVVSPLYNNCPLKSIQFQNVSNRW